MNKLEELLDEEFICINLNIASQEDLFKELYTIFYKKGYVKESYLDGIKKREDIFPTGLDTGLIKVGIPHTDCDHVIKTGIIIATLKQPIYFRKMDDPKTSIPVDIVFMLAIKEPENQANTLMKLMGLFNKHDVLCSIKNATNKEELKDIVIANAI